MQLYKYVYSGLSQVVDLHFQSTKLLKLINQLISPLTFCSIVFDIICMCFWAIYFATYLQIQPILLAAICFLLKTVVELILAADVNSKVCIHDTLSRKVPTYILQLI